MVNVALTPEDVDNLVRETILKAGIGKAVTESITKSLTGYNSPVDEAVKRAVQQCVSEILTVDPYKSQIQAAVLVAIEKRLTAEVIGEVTERVVAKMEAAARGY